MLLYLSCPDLKPGEAESSLHQLNIERRHVSFEQLLVEGTLMAVLNKVTTVQTPLTSICYEFAVQ